MRLSSTDLLEVSCFAFGIENLLDAIEQFVDRHGFLEVVIVLWGSCNGFERHLLSVPFHYSRGESDVDSQEGHDIPSDDHVIRPHVFNYMDVPFQESLLLEFRYGELGFYLLAGL